MRMGCLGRRNRRRIHLRVGILDEGIYQDHDQDGDGDPKVPNDSTQLGADEGTSNQCPVPPPRPTSTQGPCSSPRQYLMACPCLVCHLPSSSVPAPPCPHASPSQELPPDFLLGVQPGHAEGRWACLQSEAGVRRGPGRLGIENEDLGQE
jgi:hypothetical protein